MGLFRPSHRLSVRCYERVAATDRSEACVRLAKFASCGVRQEY